MYDELSCYISNHLTNPKYHLINSFAESNITQIKSSRVVYNLNSKEYESCRNRNPSQTFISQQIPYSNFRTLSQSKISYYFWRFFGLIYQNYQTLINGLLFIFAIQLRTFNVCCGFFYIRQSGVYFKTSQIKTYVKTNKPIKTYIISLQVKPERKITAIKVQPKANPICTPTPNLCRDLPKHCSLIKEKAKVIPGFVPNPMKNKANPATKGESAIENSTEPTIPIIMAIFKPNFLPELSARVGIKKKPIRAPKNIIDCRIGI